MGGNNFAAARQRLDEMGYYQPFNFESLSLVEALLHDLHAAKHDAKVCRAKLKRVLEGTQGHLQPSEKNKQQKAAERRPFKDELHDEKVEHLGNKIRDLELLNTQATAMIGRLQSESMEKSKKIQKLESKAIVVTKNNRDQFKPKIEMSSLVKQRKSQDGVKALPSSKPHLDLMEMYENKSRSLEEKLTRMRRKLENGKVTVVQQQSHQERLEERNKAEMQSNYVLQLLRENERLKREIGMENTHRFCLHSKGQQHNHHHHHHHQLHHHHHDVNTSRSCEDIRAAVQESHHLMMHNQCLQNQVGHMQNQTESILREDDRHIKSQQDHIFGVQKQLQKLSAENGELRKRIEHLTEIRKNQKDKIDELTKHQDILLQSNKGDESKIRDLIGYIERQRDLYKDSVERLLDKLDPEKKVMHQSLLRTHHQESSAVEVNEKSNLEILRDIQNDSKRVIMSRRNNQYNASDYKAPNKSILVDENKYKKEISGLKDEVDALKGKNAKLRDDLALLKLKRINENRVKVNNDTDEVDGLHERVRALQATMADLEAQTATKNSQIKRLMEDKDRLRSSLDDKSEELAKVRTELELLRQEMSGITLEKSRMRQLMLEIDTLKGNLKESESREANLRQRQSAEKSVGLETRRELEDFKVKMRQNSQEMDEKNGEIAELKSHVQKYVNEVKRVEEALNLKEIDRRELLAQYKNLSDEYELMESNGRRWEARAESLTVDLAAKVNMLEAAETRLSELEKELVETSLSNENYRGKVTTLTGKLDLAESQLKEMKTQSTWINNDLTDVHELAVKLNAQKAELQEEIAEQSKEMDELNGEIRLLRQEVADLTVQIKMEKEKSENLKERLLRTDSSVAGRL